MNPPTTPRLDLAHDTACRFLLESGCRSLPINPFTAVRALHLSLLTYSELAKRMPECPTEKDIAAAGRSNDGFSIPSANGCCIAYNQAVTSKCRLFFTIMHEAGHFMCGHFRDFNTASLTAAQYRVLEAEANFFAACVLSPAPVVTACGFNTPILLHITCRLSFAAAEIRLKQLDGYTPGPLDEQVRLRFADYIRINRVSRINKEAAGVDVP